MRVFTFSLLTLMLAASANAQTPDDPAIEACRTTGLLALKERSPALKDLLFDIQSLAVSKANTLIERGPVRRVIIGEAYLERKQATGSQRFVCLIGEKGRGMLTFFSPQ